MHGLVSRPDPALPTPRLLSLGRYVREHVAEDVAGHGNEVHVRLCGCRGDLDVV